MIKYFVSLAILLLITSCTNSEIKQDSVQGVSQTTAKSQDHSSPQAEGIVPRGIDYGATITRIGFGSCGNQDAPEPIWSTIEKTNPNLFVYLGDTVYSSKPEQKPLLDQYKKLDKIPEYRSIREKVPFLAMWDDHDFGENDGGSSYANKDQYKKEFLSYWKYLKESIPLNQNGIYHSKIIGPKNKTVQIILLDLRYNRSPLKKAENPTDPLKKYDVNYDKSATMLGDAQWQWFENELKKKSQVKVIISTIQLIANDHGFERWGEFPLERQKFFDLLKKTKAKNVVVISGDRHIGTLAKTEIKGWGTLYDLTASSINRASNFTETDQTYVDKPYSGENFGLLNIDWKNKKMTLELRDIESKVITGVDIKIK